VTWFCMWRIDRMVMGCYWSIREEMLLQEKKCCCKRERKLFWLKIMRHMKIIMCMD